MLTEIKTTAEQQLRDLQNPLLEDLLADLIAELFVELTALGAEDIRHSIVSDRDGLQLGFGYLHGDYEALSKTPGAYIADPEKISYLVRESVPFGALKIFITASVNAKVPVEDIQTLYALGKVRTEVDTYTTKSVICG